MDEESAEMTAPKVILFIACLFIFAEGIMYFYLSEAGALMILFGILNLFNVLIYKIYSKFS